MPYNICESSTQIDKLSGIVEECVLYEGLSPYVETSEIKNLDFYSTPKQSEKEVALRTYTEIQKLLQRGNKNDVKKILRYNSWPINSPIRSLLWPALCAQHQTTQKLPDEFYWEMVRQVFGNTELSGKSNTLPAFVDASLCLPFHLTRTGRAMADRIVIVLGYDFPDITYSPLLHPITSILLHFMSETEAYHCLVALLGSNDNAFINQTSVQHEVTYKTVMRIAKKHEKNAITYMRQLCPGIKLERIFMIWCWWILAGMPFQHLVRIMDCYLHEGNKVLLRVALVILNLFYKEYRYSDEPSQDSIKDGIGNALVKFCMQLPVSPAKLLHAAFNIKGLSSAYISRILLKTKMESQTQSRSGNKVLVKSRFNGILPTGQSQAYIRMMSHTLNVRELFTLWSWLPVRITLYQPVLLYTTEEHGCSLTTFYGRVEKHQPTLIIIKTKNNEVFGAYCSSRWYERKMADDNGQRKTYFGTGETFLFSLFPVRAKYPWVGINNEKYLGHTCELFMAADSKMISIGGGEGQALWLEENVRYGKTESCRTFNNPPLCPSGDFEIRVLEAYGFL